MGMGRPKGSKNKPKEILDERLAKLTAIVADRSQDAETRRDAAKALQDALEPAPPATLAPRRNRVRTLGEITCGCDPFGSTQCAECDEDHRIYAEGHARNAAKRQADTAPVEDDLSAALDAIEKELCL